MKKWISQSVALAYDSRHDRMVKVVRLLDSKGRRYEEHSVDGKTSPPILIDKPPKRRRGVS